MKNELNLAVDNDDDESGERNILSSFTIISSVLVMIGATDSVRSTEVLQNHSDKHFNNSTNTMTTTLFLENGVSNLKILELIKSNSSCTNRISISFQ